MSSTYATAKRVALALLCCGTAWAQPPSDAGVPAEPTPPDVGAPVEPAPPVESVPPADATPPVIAVDEPADSKGDKKKKKKDRSSKKPRISGFFQVFYRHGLHTGADPVVDPPNFRVQRVRIALDGDLLPWLSYDVSIDPRSPEIGGILRDAYFTVRKVIPYHRIRVGQQKTQFGYENNVSSSKLYAVNRTELSDALGRGLNLRDIGIGVLGRIPLGGALQLEDAITIVNGNGLNVQDDNNRRKNVFGRVGLRYKVDAFWVRFGVSASRGDIFDPNEPLDPADDSTTRFTRAGTDVEVDTKWLFASAEFIYGKETVTELGMTDEGDLQGWYVNLVGKTGYPVGPILRVDTLGDEYRRFLFGAYYGHADAKFRVLLNYEFRQLKDDERGDDKIYVWTQVRF